MNDILFGLKFILPTQGANVLIVDATPFIIIASLFVIYYLFKRQKTHSFEKETVDESLENSNCNINTDFVNNSSENNEFIFKRVLDLNDNNTSDTNIKRIPDEEKISIQEDKEKIKIYDRI